ncbi:SIMPL domain-containing protein [Lysobacter sp. LF1]|uniref:SIMPL domain-containing protein n=1 Tax=Lysobacter stagni TaxID=3045172 RepID=A0ABT6XDQ7_9GAMM|nr:SIMPL domain-containing protein [Lysobacter sp. LF1]MDI9238174.1 SIMPL domain-containing protein [Lysobacter sp. LF1]
MRSMHSLAFAVALLVPVTSVAGTPLPDGPHVIASGEGKVSARPDSARVSFDFLQRDARPLVAKQKVDVAVNALLEGLSRYAIQDKDIRASDLSTGEDVDFDDNGRRVSRGFVAERKVTVVLNDLTRLNEFLDFGLGAGATGIANVSFESTREKALREEARLQAIAVARQQAADLATAFGGKLGPVYSINSQGSNVEYQYNATTLDRVQVTGTRMGSSGRYLQSDVEYRESVRAVFDLQR